MFAFLNSRSILCSAFLIGIGLSACQPEDESPGLWLSGNENSSRVGDWRFTDDIQEILIETRTWYFLPHSTTIWCVQFEGNLYLGSYGSELKFWEKNIERNPQARLSINGDLYRVNVLRIQDLASNQQISEVYSRKYDMEAVFGNEIPEWWFYRVDQTL
ncbi:MAG: DUF2255 family protein [Gammaproteobacteria bacterium]|jgi:hypothetical protein|nr:DUF2255 family protein [Gammaproteobacteria bacterium]|tara:strand:- start:1376 stop:1852 length:477 start_codon:yes stop_codon:yes gene_type:complete